MAKIGANHPCWRKLGEEEGILIGCLITANVTPNFSNAQLYASDKLKEEVNAFTNGTIALETDDISNEHFAMIFDAKIDATTKDVINNINDTPPYGEFAFYKRGLRDGVSYFLGQYYPKVKAVRGANNATTRGSTVTFQTNSMTLTAFADETGNYEHFSDEFKIEDEVIAWVETKCGIATG